MLEHPQIVALALNKMFPNAHHLEEGLLALHFNIYYLSLRVLIINTTFHALLTIPGMAYHTVTIHFLEIPRGLLVALLVFLKA